MSVPREFYDDDYEGGFLEDRAGNMINPAVEHPLYLQAHNLSKMCACSKQMFKRCCTGKVPGVGFNDVVIETPRHNMCAALEREELLGFAQDATDALSTLT